MAVQADASTVDAAAVPSSVAGEAAGAVAFAEVPSSLLSDDGAAAAVGPQPAF